jgi:hypothetical protein
MTETRDIEVWFGTGDGHIAGPIEANFVEECSNGEVKFQITDPGFREHVGWEDDEVVEFTYPRLRPDNYVRYDAYAWCPKGEGPQPSSSVGKWW